MVSAGNLSLQALHLFGARVLNVNTTKNRVTARIGSVPERAPSGLKAGSVRPCSDSVFRCNQGAHNAPRTAALWPVIG